MKHKGLIISYFILATSITLSVLINFWHTGMVVGATPDRFESRMQNQTYEPSIIESIDPMAALYFLIFLNVVLAIYLSYRFLKTKKQIIILNLAILISLLVVIIVPAIPAYIAISQCRTIVKSGNTTGECLTLLENAGAFVIYLLFIFISILFTTASTIGSLITKHTNNLKKGVFAGLLIVAIFAFFFLITRFFFLRNQKEVNLQIQELPRELIRRNLEVSQKYKSETNSMTTKNKTAEGE